MDGKLRLACWGTVAAGNRTALEVCRVLLNCSLEVICTTAWRVMITYIYVLRCGYVESCATAHGRTTHGTAVTPCKTG